MLIVLLGLITILSSIFLVLNNSSILYGDENNELIETEKELKNSSTSVFIW